MSLLGNIPARSYSDIVTDFFTGDGNSTSFQLTRTPPNQSGLDVSICGITQPANRFTINNNTITFCEAPPITESEGIAVVHRYGLPINVGQVPQGSVLRSNIATGAVGPDQFTTIPSETDLIFAAFRNNVGTTHSVYRTVGGKLNDFVNIKDYGAICDGVTDDTQALKNAIDDNQGKGLVISGPTRLQTPDTINLTENIGVFFAPGGSLKPDFCGLYYCEVQDRGTNYHQVPVINVIPANTDGQNAQVKVHMEVEGHSLANIGSNYHIGDTITMTGGVFLQAMIFTVSGVNINGSITSYNITNRGDYTVLPTSPLVQGSTSGTGTNAAFSITSWRIHSNEILSTGIGYTAIPTLQYVGGGGSGASSIAYGKPAGIDCGIYAGDYTIFDLSRGGNFIGHFGYTDISAKWFGAKGDGVTNDTAALQLALNVSENVYIPKGLYLTSQPLKIKQQNQTILGSSGTVIQSMNPFNGFNLIQNFLPNTNNLTVDNGLTVINQVIKIEGVSFINQTGNNTQTSVINFVNIGKGSVIRDCNINGGGVGTINGSLNAIKVMNSAGNGLIVENTEISGFFSNNIIDIAGGQILLNRISAKSSSISAVNIVNAHNAEIDGCIFDGVDAMNINPIPLGVIIMQDCMNGTIKNTRILNKGNQSLFPAIYFRGVGSAVRNYSVEQVSFASTDYTGNFIVNIQDDNTNSTVAGIADELIRYNRYEVVSPNMTLIGRGELLGGNGIGGFIAKLPVAATFSNSVPLLLPYKLDIGNHCVEVMVSGRNITNNMPFVAKVVLMNADNYAGDNPADAHIIYTYNNPGNVGLAYDSGQKAYTLTLDSGTIYNVAATVIGNGVYTSSFGY